MNPETGLVEMMEIPSHPWFVTCQFHPEFKSKPFDPHPLFVEFVKASLQASMPKKKEPKAKLPIAKKKSRTDFRISARS
jgi:CTP synthase